MKRILTIDEKNYDPKLPELRREAVRGIIFIDSKMLLVESGFGEVKLPGGGVEDGEDDLQALTREVREETGYTLLPESVKPFGEILERRMSTHEEMIWNQLSRIYTCSVSSQRGKCHFTANEQKYGFRCICLSLDEAIQKNHEMLAREGTLPWNQREYQTLLIIKKTLTSH